MFNFDVNEDFKLIRWAAVLDRQFKMYVNSNIKKYNLNYAEFIYLINLYKHDGVNQDSISKNIYVDKAAITRTVQALEKKNLIIRIKDKSDKRSKNVFLTDLAKSYEDDLLLVLLNWKAKILEYIDLEEFNNIGDSLELITKNFLS